MTFTKIEDKLKDFGIYIKKNSKASIGKLTLLFLTMFINFIINAISIFPQAFKIP